MGTAGHAENMIYISHTVQGRLSWALLGMPKHDKHLSHTVQGSLSWAPPGMLKYDIHLTHTVQGHLSWAPPGMLKYGIHVGHSHLNPVLKSGSDVSEATTKHCWSYLKRWHVLMAHIQRTF